MALSEDDLIARFFAPIAGPDALALKDDVGLIRPPTGTDLVLTKDALVAGVHFFPDDPPASIARKALGVNLSDLAAKAATPLGFLLAIALPRAWTEDWMAAFSEALGVMARESGCPLIGGDTVSTPGPLLVSITALGHVAQGGMRPRTGAQAGDLIYVSGTVGDGALGLLVRGAERAPASDAPPWCRALGTPARQHLRDRYLHPVPRLALRAALAHANAAMDVSDGLAGDTAKMLRASGVSGRLDLARVPLSPAAAEALRLDPALDEVVFTGGDDYEVLCTVPPGASDAFERDARAAGVPVTAVGEVEPAGRVPLFLGAGGQPRHFKRASFSHG